MALIIGEDYRSRPFTIGQQVDRQRVYHIVGSDDEEAVRTLLQATAPTVYLGLAIDSYDVEPEGGGKWKGIARYKSLDNDTEYTFDTTGGTAKITQSLGTVGSYAAPGLVAPNYQGAIGVGDDRVEGVDIAFPAYSWTESKTFDDAFILAGYIDVLKGLTARTNNATFKGCAEGEVLFHGATGGKRGDEKWKINFRFSFEANRTGLSVGPITGIAKKGWEYLWIRYGSYVDPSAFALVQRPIACYVETVYLPGDFSLLVLGP
jgi:hypothetical protein